MSGVVAIEGGPNHSLALDSHGVVWGWGFNGDGELGYAGCISPCSTPTRVTGLSNVLAIAAADWHSLALRSDGTVWAWGSNASGQLGYTGCFFPCPTPTQVPGLSNVVAISAGGTHSLALRSDGTVWAWGKNSYGELGYTGCTSPCPTPTQVSGLPGVVAIAVGRNHSLGLASDGTVWTWDSTASVN